MKKILSAVLSLLLAAVLLCGCGAAKEDRQDGADGATMVTPEPSETPEPSAEPTAETTVSPEGVPLTEDELNALMQGPAWEGVYRKDDITLVIRDREGDFAVMVLDAGEAGSFSGYVQVSADAVTYTGESFALTMTLSADASAMELSLEGAFPVEGLDPSGSYSRTEEDPAGYEAALGANALPASISETVLNGKVVSVYLDPQGRFSAVLPCIFTDAPADMQPEDGVWLTTMDGLAYAAIYTESTEWEDAETAAAAVPELYENAEVYVSGGCAMVNRTFTDETDIRWGELRILCPMDGTLVTLVYAWQPQSGSAYGAYAAIPFISNS